MLVAAKVSVVVMLEVPVEVMVLVPVLVAEVVAVVVGEDVLDVVAVDVMVVVAVEVIEVVGVDVIVVKVQLLKAPEMKLVSMLFKIVTVESQSDDSTNPLSEQLSTSSTFDPENSEHNKIVQKRINMMMHSPLMNEWFKESILFGKDKDLTDEVIKFIINCAIAFFDEKEL